jgi:predicted RNase H-like HicB family nuclease
LLVADRETKEEALENIKDAIKAYLDTVTQSCLDTVEELTEKLEYLYVKVG